MPDPNLQSYIATHYLSGPKADAILARTSDGKLKRKKKKPKSDEAGSSSSSGLVFKDDSDAWKVTPRTGDEDEDELAPQVVGPEGGESRKAFKKIGGSTNSTRAAIQESVGSEAVSSAPAAAQEGTEFRAGLRTKEEMKAARLAREQRKKREAAERRSTPPPIDEERDEEARLAQETVYRDSSGRVIDIQAQQAAELELQREREKKAAERSTWNQGLVQQQQRAHAAAQLASARHQAVARRTTDTDYNAHFKDQERPDDPALAFLTKKREKGPQKPRYKGPWPPNRFNIPPGYRWDGVDRGTGFEKLLFERKSALARREQEARAWGQSDM